LSFALRAHWLPTHSPLAQNARNQTLVVVDNTFLGPVFQQPLRHGADLSLYSATKYIGGHSDILAGAALGRSELIGKLKLMRAMLGAIPSPHTCWLLTRSDRRGL
jgi:methionine-gamma-lyase